MLAFWSAVIRQRDNLPLGFLLAVELYLLLSTLRGLCQNYIMCLSIDKCKKKKKLRGFIELTETAHTADAMFSIIWLSSESSSKLPLTTSSLISVMFLKGGTRGSITVGCRAGVAEWFTALCLLHAARTVVGSSPEPPSMLVE